MNQLNRTTASNRDIARRLILFEDKRDGAAFSAFAVTDWMRPQLMRLMGLGGVRAIMARALALATKETPWLSNAKVNFRGDVEGLQDVGTEMDPGAFLEGRIILLAQLLGLLVQFIGPTLTSNLVEENWPHIALEDRDFGREL